MQVYLVSALTSLVQAQIKVSLDEYVFQFNGKPVDSVRHGKQMTLGDCSIRDKSTLILMKVGFTLTITNPQVCSYIMYLYKQIVFVVIRVIEQ